MAHWASTAYLNCHLSWKLDGYKVRLGAIGAKNDKYKEENTNCELWVWSVEVRRERETHCQNVSGSLSCKHSGPKPNLNEDTDHLARWPMSGHGNGGGLLTMFLFRKQHRRIK
jgi:hypothetical protein